MLLLGWPKTPQWCLVPRAHCPVDQQDQGHSENVHLLLLGGNANTYSRGVRVKPIEWKHFLSCSLELSAKVRGYFAINNANL